jgi:hypothetical protein
MSSSKAKSMDSKSKEGNTKVKAVRMLVGRQAHAADLPSFVAWHISGSLAL